MKSHTTIYKPIIACLLFLSFIACETLETDLTEDPSSQGIEDASVSFLFNANQLGLANFFENTQFFGAQVTRMELMGTSPIYASQYQAGSFDNVWRSAYATFLIDAQATKAQAEALETEEANGNNIIAAVQIMEAYIITTLADTFGSVPYSEALQGSDNFNPGRDSDREIYTSARLLLENAIELIDIGGSVPLPNDLFYDGNMANWRKLANSLLIKLAVTSRLNDSNATAYVNTLINEGDYLTNNSQDFQFNYSSTDDNPDSRHPLFSPQYDATAGIYMAAPYIRRMQDDPRFNYYFYLQNGEIFGREHGDSGPPVASEFNRITVHGLYPVGGKYNDGSTGPTSRADGAAGAGASIIMTNAFTQFLIAEAQLTMNGNIGGARSALQDGITASINKVTNFQSGVIPPGASEPTAAEINAYIDSALQRFDDANGIEGKLNIIITEYYKSLWGNGIESYNNFRRTGYPADMPPSISDNPGVFTNSMLYPAVYINFNNNPDEVQKQSVGQKVWWAEGTTFNLDF